MSLGSGGLKGFGKIIGGGTNSTAIEGGVIIADGGILEIATIVNREAATTFSITGFSTLRFDASVGASSIRPNVTLSGVDAELDLSHVGLADFHGVLAGLSAGQFIDVSGAASVSLDATRKQLTVFDAANAVLGKIDFAVAQDGKTFKVDNSHQIYVDGVALGAGGGAELVQHDPESAIATLFLGFLGRAGDPDGMTYWQEQLVAGMTLDAIARSFTVQAEVVALHPFLRAPTAGNVQAFIDQVYNNLFDRMADTAGAAYWKAEIQGGHPADSLLLAVALGATGADAVALVNRLSVARAFNEQIGDADLAYTDDVAELAREAIGPVVDDDTAEMAITGITAFVAGELGGL